MSKDLEQPEKERERGTSSTFGGIANLANLIVGCGVIGLPGAVCNIGAVLAFISLLVFYVVATWSANKIIEAKVLTKSAGYEEICQKLLGPFGYWMLNISLWVLLICVIWVYLVLATSFQINLWNIISHTPDLQEKPLTAKIGALCISALVLPLALFRDLSFLSFTSTLGVVCIVIFIVCSIIATNSEIQDHEAFLLKKEIVIDTETFEYSAWGIPARSDFLKIMGSMGAIFTAYGCHHGVCSIHESLATPAASWRTVSRVGIGIAFVCNLVVAFAIYAAYNRFACPNTSLMFTELFAEDGSGSAFYVNAAGTAAMSVSVISAIPLVHFFMRDLSWSIFSYARGDAGNPEMPNWFFFGHLVFWGIATMAAVFAPKAIGIINFLGNFSCSIIMIILPILLDFQMNGGILYFLSFGLSGPKRSLDTEIKETKTIEMGAKTVEGELKSRPSDGGLSSFEDPIAEDDSMLDDVFRFTVCNALLLFGMIEVAISFHTLYWIFAGG